MAHYGKRGRKKGRRKIGSKKRRQRNNRKNK